VIYHTFIRIAVIVAACQRSKTNQELLKEALATILAKKIICFGNW
jgi:hypothetical protein